VSALELQDFATSFCAVDLDIFSIGGFLTERALDIFRRARTSLSHLKLFRSTQFFQLELDSSYTRIIDCNSSMSRTVHFNSFPIDSEYPMFSTSTNTTVGETISSNGFPHFCLGACENKTPRFFLSAHCCLERQPEFILCFSYLNLTEQLD